MTNGDVRRLWPSAISARLLVSGAAAPGEIRVDGDDVWWSEARPDEGGRIQLVRCSPDGTLSDILGDGYSARSRVHEYGGGAWAVHGGVCVFVNFDDQRIYRLDTNGGDATPRPIPPPPTARHGLRYADLTIDASSDEVIAVRERHGVEGSNHEAEVINDLVSLPLDAAAADNGSAVRILATGSDFFASPAVDHDGGSIAWLRWNHPNMPWDGTELVVARRRGRPDLLVVAGGPDESVVQPQWRPDGSLTFLSDRSGWWNPYRWDPLDDSITALSPVDAEIGGPLWVFGLRSIAWLHDGRFVCVLSCDGIDHLAVSDADGTEPRLLDTPFTHIPQVVAGTGGVVYVIAGTPVDESAPYRVRVGPDTTIERLRPVRDLGLGDSPAAWFSVPTAIDVPTTDGAVTHALLYLPTNPAVDSGDGVPPLLVLGHGGPTSAARAQLSLATQYWTSRGFCVADVNYRGSTGYGRPYRNALRGRWGVADVEDCVAVARHLAATGVVDPSRLAIRGGSAGGFTALAALTFHDTFTAGASHYGIADLEVLARDTHKFEARYLDGLIGPWPAQAALYRERSPIHHVDQLTCPIAVFQGADDEVVPPEQAELIVSALRAKGLPFAAITFEGEGHGFRRSDTIVRAIEGELWFYSSVFGMALDEPIAPLPGEGLA